MMLFEPVICSDVCYDVDSDSEERRLMEEM